jgi:formate dehydrogenase major subunit
MTAIFINGKRHDCEDHLTILEAAVGAGIAIPSLCHDPRLTPIGSCRICCVDIEGEGHPQIACRTLVRDGMRIQTHSADLEAFRLEMLTLLAAHVTPDTFVAEPDKELHSLMRTYGVKPALTGRKPIRTDLSHPYIQVDMAQCISCFRCVRICEDLQGQFVWHALDRGAALRIVPDSGTTLKASSCVSCGACVDTCPSGALTDRGGASDVERWTRTICAYCGVGCEMEVGTDKDQIVSVRPVKDAPVNKGHLCVKGRYAFSFANSSARQESPLIRRERRWQSVSWDQALEACVNSLGRIARTYGPDSIGIIGSARATNEENFLAQKFARLVIGTNNVDCCARVCHTPSAAALKAMLGTGAGTNSFDDIEKARTFLVFGANPLENHPVVGARIRQQVLQHSAKLIVADPRRTELARMAHVHLRLRPGTNIPLLNAMAHVILTQGLCDREFIAQRVSELDAFRLFIEKWPAARAAEICGVAEKDIVQAARFYAAERPSMSFHGLGLTEHVQGTEGVMALVNLALLTGNIGKPGTGINPLRGQNNVQGAAQMGCDPSILTGSVSIRDHGPRFETAWRAQLPRQKGLNLLEMIDVASSGRLKALWIIGYDILPTLANMNVTRRALDKLEFVVVQDLFLTKTADAAADVFLPAASTFEKDGTFMNAERRIQLVRKVIEPPGNALTDWQIISGLARRMGHGAQFAYRSSEDIWNEIRQVWPAVAGITYSRLEQAGVQWPCATSSDPGTTILHGSGFAHGPRAGLRCIEYRPTPEKTSIEFPFLLTTGRSLYQFNAGTMTMRTANRRLRPTDILDIAPDDAQRLGIKSGDRVRVQSRYGSVRMVIKVKDDVSTGELFATFQDPRIGLNRLTGPYRDTVVQAPEFKVTAVNIELLRGRQYSEPPAPGH